MTWERHVYEDGYEIEYNGETIYQTTAATSYPNDEALDAMLEEANVSTPLKELLRSLFNGVETTHHDSEIGQS